MNSFPNTREIQQRLSTLGFNPGVIDGVIGPKTESAIIGFKKSVGLAPRAYVGPLTVAALMGTPSVGSDLPWLSEAQAMKGIHESRDVSRLKLWFNKAVAWIDPRQIPWCGAFVATALRKAYPDIVLPANPLGARNWALWGQSCVPQLGAVMVFWRGSKTGIYGHVAFYWGEDDTSYHVLGGNQSDAVTVTRVGKERFLAARWVPGVALSNKIVRLANNGQPLSTNEA